MQDSKVIQKIDSDVQDKSATKYNLAPGIVSNTFLGQFDSMEALKASLTEDHYDDSKFALVGDEIVLIFQIKESSSFEHEMVSYRNAQGGLISKEESFREAAEAELARLSAAQLQHNFRGEEAGAVDAAALANAAAALAPGLGDDVKFTEASPFEASAENAAAEFLPLEFVVAAMESAKIDQAFIDKIKKDCHPDAGNTTIPEGQRIFLVNRALRLAISEAELEDTIQVRMLISDQLSADNWRQIIVKGLIPAIKGTLPLKKAK